MPDVQCVILKFGHSHKQSVISGSISLQGITVYELKSVNNSVDPKQVFQSLNDKYLSPSLKVTI